MFSVPELTLLMIVGLLVLGPERLTQIAVQVGRWVGRSKRLMRRWTAEIEYQTGTGNPMRKSVDLLEGERKSWREHAGRRRPEWLRQKGGPNAAGEFLRGGPWREMMANRRQWAEQTGDSDQPHRAGLRRVETSPVIQDAKSGDEE